MVAEATGAKHNMIDPSTTKTERARDRRRQRWSRPVGGYPIPFGIVGRFVASLVWYLPPYNLVDLNLFDAAFEGDQDDDEENPLPLFSWDPVQWERRADEFIALMPADLRERVEGNPELDARDSYVWQFYSSQWWITYVFDHFLRYSSLIEPEYAAIVIEELRDNIAGRTPVELPRTSQEEKEFELVKGMLRAQARGKTQEEYAEMVGYSERHLRRLLRKWEKRGLR